MHTFESPLTVHRMPHCTRTADGRAHPECVDPALRELLIGRHHVVTAAEMAQVGADPRTVRHLAAQGEIVRLAKGVYADGTVMRETDAPQRHILRSRAMLALLPSGLALSHHSAAVMWSMPWLGAVPTRVHLVRTGAGQQRRSTAYTIYRNLPDVRVLDSLGMPVVEPAYALLGVAAEHGLRQTVVALDGALQSGIIDGERINEVVAECGGWPGRTMLQCAMNLADPRCESPGETLTRLLLRSLGIPARSQVTITASGPSFTARVDFLLEANPVVIEFDGMMKYGSADQGANRRALVAEKQREDRLRSLGYEVVRLVWADLKNPDAVRRRIEAACRRSSKVA